VSADPLRPRARDRGLNVYYGASHALQGVDLRLDGGVLSVVGRNGMGKTTLCKAIMGMVPAASGSITFAGQPLTGLTRRDRAHGRGLRAAGPAAVALADGRRASADGGAQGRRLDGRADLFDLPAAGRTQEQWRRAALGRRAADAGDQPRAAGQPAPAGHGRADRGAGPGHRRPGRGDAAAPGR
jgi:ATPase subunit of ABC transporter with duplicated ATPase domains